MHDCASNANFRLVTDSLLQLKCTGYFTCNPLILVGTTWTTYLYLLARARRGDSAGDDDAEMISELGMLKFGEATQKLEL